MAMFRRRLRPAASQSLITARLQALYVSTILLKHPELFQTTALKTECLVDANIVTIDIHHLSLFCKSNR